MTASQPDGSQSRISRGDIEAKLREIKTEVDTTATDAKPQLQRGVIIAAVVVVAVVYMLGRRKGSKRSTIVEIRRV